MGWSINSTDYNKKTICLHRLQTNSLAPVVANIPLQSMHERKGKDYLGWSKMAETSEGK